MRKYVILAVLGLFACALSAEGIFHDDSFFTRDKIDHFFTGMVISSTSYLAAENLMGMGSAGATGVSVSLTGVFSIGKEIYDGVSGTGEVSYKDLIYDFLGMGAGILIVRLR